MSVAKKTLQKQFESENPVDQSDKKPEYILVNVERFKKMLKFFTLLRNEQQAYFGNRTQEQLIKAKALEAKADKVLKWYQENEHLLTDCPFIDA